MNSHTPTPVPGSTSPLIAYGVSGVTIAILAVIVAPLPAVVWLAALLPVCMWAAIICLLTRGSGEPRAFTFAALAAGAVLAAWPASFASQGFHDWLGVGTSTAAPWLSSSLVAPGIEELFKAAVLLLLSAALPSARLDVLRGIRRGALIGIGFSMLENTQYLTLALIQGGMPGLWRAAYVRGVVGGLAHAVFAATVGAGIGIAVQTSNKWVRLGAVLIGLSVAFVQHAVWNTWAAGTITTALCDPPSGGGPCRLTPQPLDLFVVTPLIAILALGPGIGALCAAARRRSSCA